MTNVEKWRLPTEQEARVVLAIFTCPRCGREVRAARQLVTKSGEASLASERQHNRDTYSTARAANEVREGE